MRVIGLCRFSYPALGGFQVEHDSVPAREAYLYAPARMEERFRTFAALTLPPLRAQTDPDFTLVIVVGESLPSPCLARLRALVADLPQAVIQAHPPGPHRQVMRQAINAVRGPAGDGPSAQFRMDDDDAVAVDFVERLRAEALANRGLFADNRHFAVDFNRGFIARADAHGLSVAPTTAPLTTAALGVVFRRGVDLTVMNFGHAKLARHMPVIRRSDSDMLIRGHNDHNDSRQKDGIAPVALRRLDPEGEAHVARRFAIDCDQVRAIHLDRGHSDPGHSDPGRDVGARD
jgi:hypothetical protein